MVRRVFTVLYREIQGIHDAAYVLALFAFGSQLLALVRDRLLAAQFGAGLELDIYYAAFRIPDLLYALFAAALSVYVLLPFVIRRVRGEKKPADPARLLSQVFSLFLLSYSLVALVALATLPVTLPWLFPDLAKVSQELTLLTAVLLVQPLLLGISSLVGVVTQLEQRFVLYAVSPLLYNVGIILGIVFFYPFIGLIGLACGVLLGAVGHLVVQLPLLHQHQLRFGFTTQIVWSDIRAVLQVAFPRVITLSLQQLTLLFIVSFASGLTVGSVAIFQLAFNLQSVPLALVGASYSIAAFPMLADLFATQKLTLFRQQVTTAVRHIMFWAVPITILCIVLRAQIVRVVLGAGAFDWTDTRLTAAVLALLVTALLAQAVYLLLVRVFYAAADTRTPLFVSLVGTVVIVGLTYGGWWWYQAVPELRAGMVSLLRLDTVAGAEVVVVAGAFSVGLWLQTIILSYLAIRRFDLAVTTLSASFVRAIYAGVVGGAVAYVALQVLVEGIRSDTLIGILLQGGVAGAVGVVSVMLAYAVVRAPELVDIYRMILACLRRSA